MFKKLFFGNILGIADTDMYQVTVVMVITLLILLIFWKDLLLVFFMKYKPKRWVYQANIINYYFFSLLSACVVSALQTVGAILVIAMVITPEQLLISSLINFVH